MNHPIKKRKLDNPKKLPSDKQKLAKPKKQTSDTKSPRKKRKLTVPDTPSPSVKKTTEDLAPTIPTKNLSDSELVQDLSAFMKNFFPEKSSNSPTGDKYPSPIVELPPDSKDALPPTKSNFTITTRSKRRNQTQTPTLNSRISVPYFCNTQLQPYNGTVVDCRESSWIVLFDDGDKKEVQKSDNWTLLQ